VSFRGGKPLRRGLKCIYSRLSEEKDVTRAIVGAFLRQFEDYAESDVIIIGGGPSGLMAGKRPRREGHKTLIVGAQ